MWSQEREKDQTHNKQAKEKQKMKQELIGWVPLTYHLIAHKVKENIIEDVIEISFTQTQLNYMTRVHDGIA